MPVRFGWPLFLPDDPAPQPVRLAVRHAPKGGTRVHGKPYAGGRFLPLEADPGQGTLFPEADDTPPPRADIGLRPPPRDEPRLPTGPKLGSGLLPFGKEPAEPEQDAWADFRPNEYGYQARDLPGLDRRYWIAQQAPDRFDIIESERGSTRAIVTNKKDGWAVDIEGTARKTGPGTFQNIWPTQGRYPTPQAAALAFNEWLKAHENPEGVTLAEYKKWNGEDRTHRTAVGNALAAGRPVSPDVLADYPDLRPAEFETRIDRV